MQFRTRNAVVYGSLAAVLIGVFISSSTPLSLPVAAVQISPDAQREIAHVEQEIDADRSRPRLDK